MKTIQNIILTVVVAAFVGGASALIVAPKQTTTAVIDAGVQAAQDLGAAVNGIANVQAVIWQFSEGISLDAGGSNGGNGDILITKGGTLGPGQNQGGWTNKTGRTVYVDYAEFDAVGTGFASSSLRISAFSTTTATVSTGMFLTAPVQTGAGAIASSSLLIDNRLIATSSPALYLTINSDLNPGTNATGTVAVPDGSSVLFYLRQDSAVNCTGSSCEAATSTNKGINAFNWFLSGHYKK